MATDDRGSSRSAGEQERFVRSCDGVEIYVRSVGSGPPLVLCDGIGCDGYAWSRLIPAFKDRFQIIHLHYRGHGRSQPPPDPNALLFTDLGDDLLAVVDAFGIEKPVLLGHSMGVQVILEFALQHPDRVAGLVPMCGSFGRPLDTLHDSDFTGSMLPHILWLTRRIPRTFQKLWTTLLDSELAYNYSTYFELRTRRLRYRDWRPFFTHLATMDVPVFMRVLEQMSQHTTEDRLDQLQVPTLVVAGAKDRFTPVRLSEYMQQLIPDAELLVVPTGTHCAPLELPELVHLRLDRFLKERVGL
jgi:pimeloyl-ACP methyl ester carboxylesterase